MTDNSIDLFEDSDSLPSEVQAVLDKYMTGENTWEQCRLLEAELKPLGYTFEWGLSGEPYDLRKI